jgi:hypothetical protein
LRKDEFLKQIEDCNLPDSFDQHLLDHASSMFLQWGKSTHASEGEHLFERFGLADERDDSNALKREKEALRCLALKVMNMQVNREDASDLMKNMNRIRDPNYTPRL